MSTSWETTGAQSAWIDDCMDIDEPFAMTKGFAVYEELWYTEIKDPTTGRQGLVVSDGEDFTFTFDGKTGFITVRTEKPDELAIQSWKVRLGSNEMEPEPLPPRKETYALITEFQEHVAKKPGSRFRWHKKNLVVRSFDEFHKAEQTRKSPHRVSRIDSIVSQAWRMQRSIVSSGRGRWWDAPQGQGSWRST